MADRNYKRRPVLHWAALLLFIFGSIALGGWWLVTDPRSPLDDAWNPLAALDVQDPYTSLTEWKLTRALGDDALCLAALETGATFSRMNDLEAEGQCGISPRVSLSSVVGVSLRPVETRCQTALRLAMWTQHDLRPAARHILNAELTRIDHFSSYNCRRMRLSNGQSGRMSTHATADAIDISGFRMSGGVRLDLKRDWTVEPKGAYLRRANETACKWFRVTLGPNYNALHADHFHLQHTGWGLCR